MCRVDELTSDVVGNIAGGVCSNNNVVSEGEIVGGCSVVLPECVVEDRKGDIDFRVLRKRMWMGGWTRKRSWKAVEA